MTWMWDGDEWRSGSHVAGTPPPPPPPSGGTPYISQLYDLNGLFWEPTGNTTVVENSSFSRISTPSGPGLQFVCTDANQAQWNSGNKAVLAEKTGVTSLGQTQDWTWDMYLPSQTIGTNYVLWEFHTDTSSGHHIGINTDNTYRFGRQSAIGQSYVRNYSGGPSIPYNTWHPMRIQIKWSTGSDGFLRMWANNIQAVNFVGATQFSGDGTPKLQFGWYGVRPSGVTNTVKFGNIQRAVS